MTISEHIVVADSLRATPDGFELQVRLNWYRSLPLSCLQTLELSVGGAAVARADIRFAINGRERSLAELEELTGEDWFVQDPATLRVRRSPALRAGERVEVSLRLGNRIPYIVTGPASALEQVSTQQLAMTAR